MKEIKIKDSPDIEIRAEQQQKAEHVLLGSQLKRPGHTLFEYNRLTGEIREAEFEKQDLVLDYIPRQGNRYMYKTIKSKVVINNNCIYRQALNKFNAVKRLKREGYTNFTPAK